MPTKGEVCFKGDKSPAWARWRWPSAAWRAPSSSCRSFPQLTVAETIAAAVVAQQAQAAGACSPPVAADERHRHARARRSPHLRAQKRLERRSRLLSQGEKKLLDVAIAPSR